MRIVRRAVSVIGLMVMAGGMAATPAGALHNADVVGHVTGQAPFTFGEGCSFVRQHFVGTIDTPAPGDSSIDVDVCITLGAVEDPAQAEGTFTLETPSGTLSGTATGTVGRTLPKEAFTFTLQVGENRAQRVGAGSTLYFRGVWKSDVLFGGPIKGRIGTQPH